MKNIKITATGDSFVWEFYTSSLNKIAEFLERLVNNPAIPMTFPLTITIEETE